MKKLNLWLLASLFVTALTLTSCSKDDEDDPKKEQLTVKDLMGTWVYTNPFNEGHYLELTLAEDNTLSLSVHFNDGKSIMTWSGSWAEEEDHIAVTFNKYNNREDVEGQSNLYYQKMFNGILMYFDNSLPKGTNFGGIFVREGETLDLSKLQTKDEELIGKWETEDKERRFIINADGTMEYAYKGNYDHSWLPSEGIFVEIDPLPVSEGEPLKQFVSIRQGSYMFPSILSATFHCYVIQDDQLYMKDPNDVESLDDLLKMTPYARVTE